MRMGAPHLAGSPPTIAAPAVRARRWWPDKPGIDPIGAALIPRHLHDIDARECAYAALLDEIAALVDPDPADPWPRHDEHSGASIAATTAAYRRAGGMPAAPLGEDRQFFAALRRVDARIRHDRAGARGRLRAHFGGERPGGMADTIRRRMQLVDALIDDRLEPAAAALRRVRLRATAHRLWHGQGGSAPRLAAMLGIADRRRDARPLFRRGLGGDRTGQSRRCGRHRVALADLARETALGSTGAGYVGAVGRASAPPEDRDGILLRPAAE